MYPHSAKGLHRFEGIKGFAGTLNELAPPTEVPEDQVIKCLNFKAHADGISRVKRTGYSKFDAFYNFGGLPIRGLFDYWDETPVNRYAVIASKKIFSRAVGAGSWTELYSQVTELAFPVKPVVYLRERPIVVGFDTNRLVEPTMTYGLGIEAPVSAPTLGEGSGGALIGTFKYVITYLRSGNYQAESNPGPESSPITTGSVGSVHRARTSNVATIGTAGAHGLTTGNGIVISGMGGAYNGTWVVASAPDTTHFTYANTGVNETETADTGGTIKFKKKITLSAIPNSSDPKVDKKEIYRTTEGGAIFFWVAEIDHDVTAYEDNITELGDQVSYDRYCPPVAIFAEVWDDKVWFVPKSARNQLQFTNTGYAEEMAYDNIIQVKGKDSDEIMMIRAYMDSLHVLKHRSIWRLDKIGDSSYELTKLPFSTGTDAPGTVAVGGGLMMWLSKRGIEILNGQSILDPPISNLIPKTMASINQAAITKSFGEINEKEGEYWLAVPTGISTEPNLIIVFDYLRGKIDRYEFAKKLTAMHNIRDANSKLQFITGTSDGNLYIQDSGYTDDGANIEAEFMTKQYCCLTDEKGLWNVLRRLFAEFICPARSKVILNIYKNQEKFPVVSAPLEGSTPSDLDEARRVIMRRVNLGVSCAYFCLEFIHDEIADGEVRILTPEIYFKRRTWKKDIEAD